MAWIRVIPEAAAEGELRGQYEAAIARAGRVFNIVKLSSLNPQLNKAFMEVYVRLMRGPSDLSRRTREMLATVVSATNSCHY